MKAILALAIVVLLLLAAAGTHRFLAKRKRRQMETEALLKRRDALFDVIESLIRQRPFTVEAVARITGKILEELPRRPGQPFTEFSSGRDWNADLQGVDLRLPAAAGSEADGAVYLVINVRLPIKPEDVAARFGGNGSEYEHAWGAVRFFQGPRRFVPKFTPLAHHSVLIDAGGLFELWDDVFAPYPNARYLCRQYVDPISGGGGFSWSAYATPDPPEKVTDFYVRKEGKENVEMGQQGPRVRRGNSFLAVHSASAKGYPSCGVDPGPDDRTVIIVR
ncbi:MAG: hypothetical protein AAB225_15365 [Acidobacteriota bacterium]